MPNKGPLGTPSAAHERRKPQQLLWHGQDIVWHTEPLRRRAAIRKEGNANRRTVGQQLMQLGVMNRRRARDIEGGFDWRVWRVGKAPVQRDVKDKPEVQINRVERRQIGESIERLAGSRFRGLDEHDNLVHDYFGQNVVWLPEKERVLFSEKNMLRKFQNCLLYF